MSSISSNNLFITLESKRMLANVLAIIVGVGSLAFYLVAFILPEVHRRSDFFWSGVGMFYAVVLWYCARQMDGAVLLGQTASVGLLLWLGYQTLLLRRETTPAAQQTPIRLGKAERSRTASRPIAKDYEFVEDGVEDALDQEPAPDSPILIKPTADEFAPKNGRAGSDAAPHSRGRHSRGAPNGRHPRSPQSSSAASKAKSPGDRWHLCRLAKRCGNSQKERAQANDRVATSATVYS